MSSELLQVISQLEREKGIDREVILDAVKAAVLSASRKQYGAAENVDALLDTETGRLELRCRKEVVESVENPEAQIALPEARLYKPEVQVGETLEYVLEVEGLGRIAAQTAKQVILQRVREAERENIYNEYKDREGELVNGIVTQVDRGNIYVDIGRAEAILPRREQIFRETYRRGERVRAYILEVKRNARGPQVVLSRTHPGLLTRLFEMEVPEIYEGIVEIKVAVREPSGRSKIAVVSHDKDVDPVGACVGTRGSRVQTIVQELRGEKIDIIPWTEDIRILAANALSPARIQDIILDEEHQTLQVIVPDDQLSLAIGKGGQNVRLAAKLLKWKIDIIGDTEYRQALAALEFGRKLRSAGNLRELERVGEKLAQTLEEHGFKTIASLAEAGEEGLVSVPGVGAKRAESLKQAALRWLEEADTRAEREKPSAAEAWERALEALTQQSGQPLPPELAPRSTEMATRSREEGQPEVTHEDAPTEGKAAAGEEKEEAELSPESRS